MYDLSISSDGSAKIETLCFVWLLFLFGQTDAFLRQGDFRLNANTDNPMWEFAVCEFGRIFAT